VRTSGARSRGADLILRGGRVWAGLPDDDAGPEPSAVAIADGSVLGLGDDAAIDRWRDPGTRVIDVGGRRIVPGLIDSHLHALRAGHSYLDEVDWTEVDTLAQALASIRAAAATRRADEWIAVLGGWHPAQFRDESRMPTPAELTEASPANPVFVHPLYGYEDHAVLNGPALRALGWTGSCPDPDGGVLERDADGSPNGVVRGLALYQRIAKAASDPDLPRAVASTRAFLERLAALGLTGVVDAGGLGMSPDRYRAVRNLWREGMLPIRVRMNVGPVTRGNERAEVERWQEMLDPALGDDLLAVLGLGEVVHFGCHDWEGLDPFEIDEDSFSEFVATLKETARRRWPVTVHGILEPSVGRILDAFELVAAETPLDGLRWNLCHAELISRHDLERVRRLGLGLAVQGRLSQKVSVVAERWGEQAVRRMLPMGDMLELGIPVGAGTDGTRAASYNPWQSLWFLVSGRSRSGGPERDERNRLDRAHALDAYTRGSAWFSFEDDRRGLLRPGAAADIAVLSADYFAIPEDAIPALTSELTIVAGRIVHRSPVFAELPIQTHARRPSPAPWGGGGQPRHTVLRLQNSRMPAAASSRPYPELFTPPNGSSG